MASEIITGEDFYQTAYGILFDCMVEMFQSGKAGRSDHASGLSEGKRCSTGDQQYGICERSSHAGIRHPPMQDTYAKIVREKSVMRRLIKVNEETANTCYQQNKPLG